MKPKNQQSKTQIVKANGGIHIKITHSDLKVNNSDSTIKGREE